MFVRKVGVDGGTGGVRGEGRDQFGENEGLLTLRCWELKVVLLKDNDPSSEFAINLSTTEKILHRFGICDDLGGAKQNVMAQFLDYKDNCKRKFLFVFILQGWSWDVLTNVVNDMFMIVISELDEDAGYWYSWCWYVEDVVAIVVRCTNQRCIWKHCFKIVKWLLGIVVPMKRDVMA
jgi:hypothetical protein